MLPSVPLKSELKFGKKLTAAFESTIVLTEIRTGMIVIPREEGSVRINGPRRHDDVGWIKFFGCTFLALFLTLRTH